LKGDQIAGHQFLAGPDEFVLKADFEQLGHPSVRVETDSILIGDSNQDKVEKLLQASQSLVKALSQESMVDPAEGTFNRADAIRTRRLGSFFPHLEAQGTV
jgi:hypothetical protein